MPSTRELIDQARAREAALAQVASLMAEARGSAHALDGTVEVTVDALGALRSLWLAPSLTDADPVRVAELILEVTRLAMREATQDSYNKVALQLGEDVTWLIEQLSGQPAPARAADDDPGMTVEEFQRQRAERLAPPARRTSTRPPSNAEDDAYFDQASPWTD
ncbi:YbaB/EbfC family nucleoid-associated protein [Amycolatopsis rhabdoformis]|uniref:YbaB/EbfC family nucleoid-associated protein n=1 Tax=Amycolatopsis rhabdoformis TaxID=1448059 RepID=A0ABZ1I855_9PSEU|nr:YbaB/EbfC family nucleoid-associated protein [Amycolatopsis rhabdoformis]WSE29704.1 YbaB/EbfC family nucleoid-associated protein [Amycolatopsis rhabdoformis]